MGVLTFFLDAKKVIFFSIGIVAYTTLLDPKSILSFFDIVVIGVGFWFGLSLAALSGWPGKI